MTNALAVLTKREEELSELELAILAEAEEDATAFDLVPPRIKIGTGGSNVFQSGDDVIKEFSGVILISQKARAYWPSKGGKVPPLCSSYDSIKGIFAETPNDGQVQAALEARTPHRGAVLLTEKDAPWPDQPFSCAACALSKFGSAHQGGNPKGKACKELRRMVVILDGWAIPALLTLPPMSIGVWDVYATKMRTLKKQYFTVRTKVTLEKAQSAMGDPYSVAQFEFVNDLTDDEQRAVIEVRHQYKTFVSNLPLDLDDYSTGNSSTDADDPEVVPF